MKRPVWENRTPGSVWGLLSNWQSYHDGRLSPFSCLQGRAGLHLNRPEDQLRSTSPFVQAVIIQSIAPILRPCSGPGIWTVLSVPAANVLLATKGSLNAKVRLTTWTAITSVSVHTALPVDSRSPGPTPPPWGRRGTRSTSLALIVTGRSMVKTSIRVTVALTVTPAITSCSASAAPSAATLYGRSI